MANTIERLALLITANADGAISVIRELTSTSTQQFSKVENEAAAAGKRSGSAFGGALSSTALAGFATLAATAAAFKGVIFAKESIQTAVEFNRATESINATLEATGNTAGTSAAGIDKIAESLEKTQATFAGTVKQGASVLLTFDAVRNQPGQGNAIFDRTLEVSTAIANVWHKDLPSSIKQVGLALENPQAGLLALKRSGVGLDEQTRNEIVALTKKGDLLGAQRTLLDDLDRRFTAAGQAVAKADPLQQFSVAESELKKTIGEDLLPPLTAFLHVAQDVFGVLGHFPKPVREVIELLTAGAIAAVPFLGIGKVFGAINAIKVNTTPQVEAVETSGSVAAENALTGAITAETEAATESIGVNAALSEQLGLFGENAATIAVELTPLDGALAGTTEQLDLFGSSAATIAVELEPIQQQLDLTAGSASTTGGVLAATGEQFALFGEDAALLSVSLPEINDQLGLFDATAAGAGATSIELAGGVAEATSQLELFAQTGEQLGLLPETLGTISVEVAGLNEQLSLLGTELTGDAEQLGLFDTSAETLAVTLPPVNEQLALFDAELGAVSAEAGPATAALQELVVGADELVVAETALEEETAALTLSLGGIISVVGAGIGALVGGQLLLDKWLGGKHESFDVLNRDVTRFGDAVERVNHTSFIDKVFRSPRETHQAQLDIGDVNKGLTNILDTQGTDAAEKALGRFVSRLIDAGYSESEAAEKLDPFITALHDAEAAENSTSTATSSLVDKFHALSQSTGTAEANLKIADSFDALSQAEKTLKTDTENLDAVSLNNFTAGLQKPAGLLEQGNLDLLHRQIAKNADGSISTVRSITVGVDQGAVLLPTVINGKVVSDAEAIAHWKQTGENLGHFASEAFANAYADTLHKQQSAFYGPDASTLAVVQADKAVGESQRSLEDANQNVVDSHVRLEDSYVRLTDAQDRVKQSAYSLQRAQEALDEYNSPRGAEERRLQLDIIQRRVVTTPGESDQKQLDLLKFGDDNAHKQEDLQNSVTQAAKGVRDAYRGVEDAQRGIIDAQRSVRDSVVKVQDAEDNLKGAVLKRAQVSKDAATAVSADERKVKEAALGVKDAIDQAAQNYELLDPQLIRWAKRLDPILVKLGLITQAQADLITNAGALADLPPGFLGTAGPQGTNGTGGVNWHAGDVPTGPASSSPGVNWHAGDVPTGPASSSPGVNWHAGNANGAFYFALGGFSENHVAQFGGGGMRVWNEKETFGEAYIPLADSKRSGSLAILSKVADHFGMALMDPKAMHFADGGTSLRLPSVPGGGGPARTTESTQHIVNVKQENHFANTETPAIADLDYANRELGWRLSRSGRR